MNSTPQQAVSPVARDPLAQPSLDEQRAEFIRARFLAMPIAGAICWAGIGIAGALLSLYGAVWAVFIGTGMIYLVTIYVLVRRHSEVTRPAADGR